MSAYDQLIERVRDASLLGSTASILSWDQEVLMPPGGVEHRSRQLSQLATMSHRMFTNPEVGELLAKAEAEATGDAHSDEMVNLREIRHSYDRATKLPDALVAARAEQASKAQHSWIEARKNNDFASFAPTLARTLELEVEAANAYGVPEGGEIWDALAEGYEPGMRAANIEELFAPLRTRLVALIDSLMGGSKRPSSKLLEVELDVEKQEAVARTVAAQLGFDFDRGRLDKSTHPFCGGSNTNDVRMTGRFSAPNFLNDGLTAVMHETGHAIYEQNIPYAYDGTPLGQAAGLGIHESQSRLWENFVGRSRPFWEWAMPLVADTFGDTVAGITAQDGYESSNVVEPAFIRVEADEATYNLHIMVRFELERELVSGRLAVKDLPEAWNARYSDYLGVTVPSDTLGCLQDIHWPMGAIGYFPTYTLGNLHAAQFYKAAQDQLPGLEDDFADGNFTRLREWLTENIHVHGKRYTAAELVERITGESLNPDYLLTHLENKLKPLYGVN